MEKYLLNFLRQKKVLQVHLMKMWNHYTGLHKQCQIIAILIQNTADFTKFLKNMNCIKAYNVTVKNSKYTAKFVP